MPFIGRRARNALEQATLRPQAAQHALLARLIRANKDTVFGREHAFDSIKSSTDFRASVPIRDYEEFRPYVDRMVDGEGSVLTVERPIMFATTSGTTGQSKFIPVNKSFREDLASTSRAWLSGVFDDYPEAFDGACFVPVTSAIEGHTKHGMPYGSMSGLTYQSAPWLFQRSYAVPYEATLLENYDLRYYAMMRLAVGRDVTLALTANPSTWLRLADAGVTYGTTMIEGIRHGRIGIDLETIFEVSAHDAKVLHALDKTCAALPKRADELAASLREHGALLPKHVWPRLKVLVCWLGGSAGIQARWLTDYFGSVPIRDPGFRASEAMMSIPLHDHSASGVLAVHVNYYEFIPEEAIHEDNPPVYEAHELVVGQAYYILLTTRGGLYRYDINDVVRVEGFYKKAPIVAFLRKGRDMVSITGEKLHVNQVIQAVENVEKSADLRLFCYCLIPDVQTMRYDLVVELEATQPPDTLGRFLGAFDEALKALNSEYASKRDSGRLLPPRLTLMQSGWSDREKQRQVEVGKRDVQFKWPLIQDAWKSDYDTEVLLVQELNA
jgi:hypothetical protein